MPRYPVVAAGVTQIATANGTSRAYTVMRFGLFGGAKRLRTLADELSAVHQGGG